MHGTASLVVVDLLLLVICAFLGGFHGFVVWLVLSFVGFYANHVLNPKRAELLLKAQHADADFAVKMH